MPPSSRTLLTTLLLAIAFRAQAGLAGEPSPSWAPEAGLPFVTHFAPADYDAGLQNWDVAEDGRGVIYVGNNSGLLEYDGATWRLLRPPMGTGVRSVASDAEGRIWWSGRRDLGYLAPDSLGRLAFVSLRDEVPEPYRDNHWTEVHATDEGVFFGTPGLFLYWNGEAMEVVHVTSNRTRGYVAYGDLYVSESGRGLLRLKPTATGPAFRLAPGGERFAHTGISAILPFDEVWTSGRTAGGGRVLIATSREGLFLYDGVRAEPFETEVDEAFAESGIHLPGAALPGGRFALALRGQGLVVIDRQGRFLLHLHRGVGLRDDTVLYTYMDSAGDLWLGQGRGVTHVEVGSPYTWYGADAGLPSTALALTRHEGRLYAANMHGGLTYLDAASGAFRPVPGSPSHSRSLDSAAGDLLVAGTSHGVHRVRTVGSTPIAVSASQRYLAHAVHAWRRDPSVLVVGINGGLAVLQRSTEAEGSPTWVEVGRVEDFEYGLSVTEAADGTLWVGLRWDRLARVRLPEPRDRADDGPPDAFDLSATEVTVFGPEHGLPEGGVPYPVGDEVYVSFPGERLLRYDEAVNRFVEDHTFDAARSRHPLARLVLREGIGGRVWIASTYGAPILASPRAEADGGGYTFEPLHRFRRSRIHDVYPEDDGVVWLMGSDEIVRYDTRDGAALGHTFEPLVRRVAAGGDLLYGGVGEATSGVGTYGVGAVRFSYAAPGGAVPTRYRTRLDGFDAGWSDWTAATERAYTNLPPGSYRFVVEAEGQGEAAYALVILPPWYRTWWAYGLYALGAVGLIAAVVSQRTRHLRRRQRELDAEVAERTRELHSEKRKTEAQAERLREMDRLKSRFFANVSHEFRTPLTLTIGPLEDLQTDLQKRRQGSPSADGDAALPAAAWQCVDLALRNSRRLLRLINQLLDIAKLEAGELRLDARRGDLAAFVRGTARSFVPLAERRRVHFTVEAPDAPVPVRFDEEKLEQVLANLLSNAFKFTPEGGAICVSVSYEDEATGEGAAVVAVRDSGPGIAPEALPHLFERFYQAEETHSEMQAGTGIGLSLAKDLVELHGGTIAVESAAGFGTTFAVRLPLAHVPLGDGEAADLVEVFLGAHGESAGTMSLPVPGDGWPATGRLAEVPDLGVAEDAGSEEEDVDEPAGDDRTTILIADDNAEIRAYVRGHLEPRYCVLEATDGREALEKARAALPDLILSDVMMPHLDGFELVRTLRDDRETDFIPVVLLTARADEEDKVEGLSEGADAYLTKPFNVRELQAHVDNLIASRQRLRARFASRAPALPQTLAVSSIGSGDGGAGDLLPSAEAYVASVRAVVESKLHDDSFGVGELAAALEQSRSTLYRRLRDTLDRTPTAFIREVRLERAAALLRERSGTVSEVAYAVGFRSVSHFCQTFRDAYGVTPSAHADGVPSLGEAE